MAANITLLVESSRHQTTCRRVRDCCAQIHNITQTWSSLSSQSFDVLSRLMNTLTKEDYVEKNEELIQENSKVKIRITGKMIEKREELYSQLQQLVSQMVSA